MCGNVYRGLPPARPMSTPISDDPQRAALRQELEAGRAVYHALLAAIPDDAWERPSGNPAWNVRQMMFHITTALRFLPLDVRAIRQGRAIKPPMGLFHFLNKWFTRLAAWRQTRASLAAEYDRRHAQILALLDTLSPADLALGADYPVVDENLTGGWRTLADVIRYAAQHSALHAGDVRAALEKAV